MKPDPDKDPGGPVPLVHKSLSEVAGVGIAPHLRNPQLGTNQLTGDPTAGGRMRNHLGLSGPNLHYPFPLAALTSHVYPPSFLGPNFPPHAAAALLSSFSGRSDHQQNSRSRHHPPPIPPPIFPSSGGGGGAPSPTLASLHATLAAGDASRHAELLAILKDSARQHELLFALSKLAAPSVSSSAPSASTSSSSPSSSSSSSSSTSSLHHSHHSSPPMTTKQLQEGSPTDKHLATPSSLSPSSYMTPRSLSGSPSAPSLGGTPNYNSRNMFQNFMSLDSISPTSPPSGGEGVNSSSSLSGTTPTRKSSTPRPDRVFTCKICSRSFGYKHVLQNHERTHTGEKPFECKECHKRFTRDHHLKTHMRLHTGEKPYHCTHCDRQFVQVANLRRHLRVHTGERPYSCDVCPSKFSDSNQLKAHLLIHKNERPFSCGKCCNKFRRRHHMIQHKCSGDPEATDKGLVDPLSAESPSSFSENDSYGYTESMFTNDEVEEGELTDEGPRSPSMNTTLTGEEPHHSEKRRGRKNKEPRRVVPTIPLLSEMPSPISSDPMISNAHLPPTPIPEQTEPEDLSMNASRKKTQHTYRANIALTSRYPKYPMTYNSSPEEENKYDDRQVESLPANLYQNAARDISGVANCLPRT